MPTGLPDFFSGTITRIGRPTTVSGSFSPPPNTQTILSVTGKGKFLALKAILNFSSTVNLGGTVVVITVDGASISVLLADLFDQGIFRAGSFLGYISQYEDQRLRVVYLNTYEVSFDASMSITFTGPTLVTWSTVQFFTWYVLY